MDSRVVVSIVIAVVVLAVVVLLKVRHKKLLARLSNDELKLHEQCVAADKAVRTAQRAYDQAVRAAESALKKAETPSQLASAGLGNYVTPISVCLNLNPPM